MKDYFYLLYCTGNWESNEVMTGDTPDGKSTRIASTSTHNNGPYYVPSSSSPYVMHVASLQNFSILMSNIDMEYFLIRWNGHHPWWCLCKIMLFQHQKLMTLTSTAWWLFYSLKNGKRMDWAMFTFLINGDKNVWFDLWCWQIQCFVITKARQLGFLPGLFVSPHSKTIETQWSVLRREAF